MEAWLADADACCLVVRRPRASCPASFVSPPPAFAPPPLSRDDDGVGKRLAEAPEQRPLLSDLRTVESFPQQQQRRRRESYHGDGALSCGTGAALAAAADARARARGAAAR
jgi:hypothetical protein